MDISLYHFINQCKIPKIYHKINFEKFQSYPNYFRFNPTFYLLCNPTIHTNLAKHYHTIGLKQGLIAHPRQIFQYYPSAVISNNGITYNDQLYTFNDFCNQFIYNIPFTQLMANSIVQLHESTLNLDNKTVVIFHIGENFPVAMQMLYEFRAYIQQYNVVMTYYAPLPNEFITFITNFLPHHLLIKTVQFGSDVQASIIAYWHLKNRLNYDCDIVFKIHTKSDRQWRQRLLACFTQSIQQYETLLRSNSTIGMICNQSCICSYKKDIYNKDILNELYGPGFQYYFSGGTIFICRSIIFDNILSYESCITTACRIPFYYDNNLFVTNSPIHAIERMFGAEVTRIGQTIIGV